MARGKDKSVEHELAERIAASMVDGVTVDQAHLIIQTFLEQLARCPVCDGSGRFTFRRDLELDVRDRLSPRAADRYIPAGTSGTCPFCGTNDPQTSGKGDSEWVGWHCYLGQREDYCRADQQRDAADYREPHADCGWRIMIPYEPPASGSAPSAPT